MKNSDSIKGCMAVAISVLIFWVSFNDAYALEKKIGISADLGIKASVGLDPSTAKLISNLPEDARAELLKVVNGFFDRGDQSVLRIFENAGVLSDRTISHLDLIIQKSINNISSEINGSITLLSRETKCAARVTVDTMLEGLLDLTFLNSDFEKNHDRCIENTAVDGSGFGNQEKLLVSECRVYKSINREVPVEIISAKLEKLESMANKYMCLNQEAMSIVWFVKKKYDYGRLHGVYMPSKGACADASTCVQDLSLDLKDKVNKFNSSDFDKDEILDRIEKVVYAYEKRLEDDLENKKNQSFFNETLNFFGFLPEDEMTCEVECINNYLINLLNIEDEFVNKINKRFLERALSNYSAEVSRLSALEGKVKAIERVTIDYKNCKIMEPKGRKLCKEIETTRKDFIDSYEQLTSLGKWSESEENRRFMNLQRSCERIVDSCSDEEKKGPNKNLIKLEAGNYRVKSHWRSDGEPESENFWCLDGKDVDTIKGMVKIGAKGHISYKGDKVYSASLKKCVKHDHCNGGKNEYCHVFTRGAGCLVSEEWYEWYKSHNLGPITYELICE